MNRKIDLTKNLVKNDDFNFQEYFDEISNSKKIKFLSQILDENIEIQKQFLVFTHYKKKQSMNNNENISRQLADEIRNELSSLDFNEMMEKYEQGDYWDDEGYSDEADDMISDVIKSYCKKATEYLSVGNLVDAFKIILAMYEGSQHLPELDADEYSLFGGEFNNKVQEFLSYEINKLVPEFSQTPLSTDIKIKLIDLFGEHFPNFSAGELVVEGIDDNNAYIYDYTENLKVFNDFFQLLLTDVQIADYLLAVFLKHKLEIEEFSAILLKIAEIKKDDDLWLAYANQFAEKNKQIYRNLLDKYKELSYEDLFQKHVEIAFNKWKDEFDEYVLDNIDRNQRFDLYFDALKNFTMSKQSIEHYKILREYLSEEDKYNFINSSKKQDALFYILMLEVEEDYPAILAFVQNYDDNIYNNVFHNIIKPVLNIYPKECFSIIRLKCDRALISVKRNRETYKIMAGWISIMLGIDALKIETKNYIASFYNSKPNLPALKDELTKAGLHKF